MRVFTRLLNLKLEAHKTHYFCVSVAERTGKLPVYAALVCTDNSDVELPVVTPSEKPEQKPQDKYIYPQ